MNLALSHDEAVLQAEVRDYLGSLLEGEFAAVRGRGGLGDEDACFEERLAFERRLARDGWTCVGWPAELGGRGLSLPEQVVFHEEYARSGGPERLGHFGENLLGPTLIHYASAGLKARFLEPIRLVQELWCQGYSEPNAGSDLAALSTRAELDGDEWVINGQKVWTSLAHRSHWCFVLARTDPAAPRHRGISFLL
ncbi:MAG TPA: acyl-CoA dehydrogenase family protein, partial [Acidimicrobiales bacterium]|nr:acyl-CoA dehydrogenase family protein [Acidimicrobiales bacterium]